jgi:D-3-phosphoglycerate dehydrogenase
LSTIYISDPIHPHVLAEITERAAAVYLGYGPHGVDYLQVADSVDAVILRAETFTRAKIEASPRLRIIARHGVGTDNVDLDAAAEQGVWVTNTPGSNGNAVAEHVFALLLCLSRHITEAAARVSSGRWSRDRSELVGTELSGRTMGVVGFGAIGRRVAAIAGGFGMEVLASDPIAAPTDVQAAGGKLLPLEDLLARADVVTLHAPLLPTTRHMIAAAQLAAMKPTAVLVNTSRGGLVDEQALVAALKARALAGAALDVLEAESVDMKDPMRANRLPLHELPTLLVTPHIAGQTTEAFLAAGTAAWEEIQRVLAEGEPASPANSPHLRSEAPIP